VTIVDIAFENRRIQALCASGRELRRVLGSGCERRMRAHVKSLLAAESLEEFRSLPGRCCELPHGRYALELGDGKRLTFRCASSNDGGAGAKWAVVRSIVLIEIEEQG
jgi:toxin HigB-1